jgi:hypothetical protein
MMYFSDEKHLAFFRLINDENIPSYRGPLMKVIAMLVRLAALVQSKKDTDKQVVKSLFLGHDNQLSESRRLCDVLVAMKGKASAGNDHISRALHRLLRSLLCPESLSDQDIACPTELFVFLESLTDNAVGYRTAASVKGHCCKLQFGFRMIYIHIVRMEAYQISDYTPFEKKATPVPSRCSNQHGIAFLFIFDLHLRTHPQRRTVPMKFILTLSLPTELPPPVKWPTMKKVVITMSVKTRKTMLRKKTMKTMKKTTKTAKMMPRKMAMKCFRLFWTKVTEMISIIWHQATINSHIVQQTCLGLRNLQLMSHKIPQQPFDFPSSFVLWIISGPSDSTIAAHFRNTESTFLKNKDSILSHRLAETLISGWSPQLVPKMNQSAPN